MIKKKFGKKKWKDDWKKENAMKIWTKKMQ